MNATPLIQIGCVSSARSFLEGEREACREHFNRSHYHRFSGFIQTELLSILKEHLLTSRFIPRVHAEIGTEECMEENVLDGLLHLSLNDQKIFSVIESFTGCPPICSFRGRMYRFVPGENHHDSWHSDVSNEDTSRVLALSINFSEGSYAGGNLQIRDAHTEQLLQEVENQVCGDAVLFRLRQGLEHRVTPVTEGAPRTVFAGWFKTGESIAEFVAERIHLLEQAQGQNWRVGDVSESVENLRVVPKNCVFERVLGEELFLVNLENLSCCRVNEVGREVWLRLRTTDCWESVLEHIAEEYEIPFDQARVDLSYFLSELQRAGLVDVMQQSLP